MATGQLPGGNHLWQGGTSRRGLKSGNRCRYSAQVVLTQGSPGPDDESERSPR